MEKRAERQHQADNSKGVTMVATHLQRQGSPPSGPVTATEEPESRYAKKPFRAFEAWFRIVLVACVIQFFTILYLLIDLALYGERS